MPHRTWTTGNLRATTNGMRYQACCTCGWISAPQTTQREADNEATDHVVAVTRNED